MTKDYSKGLDYSGHVVVEIPVQGPDGNEYILKEANGRAVKEFTNARLSGVTLGIEGKPETVRGIGSLELLLVSLCLQRVDGKPVHLRELEKWSGKIITELYGIAKEISGIDEKEDDEEDEDSAKNEQETTMDGSE